MTRKTLFFLMILLCLAGCGSDDEDKKTTPVQIDVRSQKISCLRWADRELYFATPDPFNTSVNNQFHKELVKTTLKEIEINSDLGEDYFIVREVNPDLLDPIRTRSLPPADYRSFVLIWNDDRFEQFIINNFCPESIKNLPNGQVACLANFYQSNAQDRNGITVKNLNASRKFYTILRSSCFEAGSRCVDPSTQLPVGTGGVKALVARQLGIALGMPPATASYPALCSPATTSVQCGGVKISGDNSPNACTWNPTPYASLCASKLMTSECNSTIAPGSSTNACTWNVASNKCDSIGRCDAITVSCTMDSPNPLRNNIMCGLPANDQWNENSGTDENPVYIRRDSYFAALNSHLATVKANANYYGDASTQAGCLIKTGKTRAEWMDRVIYPVCPRSEEINSNEYPIFLNDIKETLDEISQNTLLGSEYFSFPTAKDPITGQDNVQCTNETSVNLVLERQDNFEDPYSHLLLWSNNRFNNFVNSNSLSIPDINAFVLVNAAWKKKFKVILRADCFLIQNGAPDPDCYSGNNGVIETGAPADGHYKAIIARELGFMAGLETKDCNDNPMDVMCADLPNKEQWSNKYKKRFFNKLNNYLERIGNDPRFYDQVFEEIENTEDD